MLVGAFVGGASVLYTLYICIKHHEYPFYYHVDPDYLNQKDD